MGANGLIAVGVPPQPLWLLYIKIGILVLSLIIFCLSCFILSVVHGSAAGMTLFVCLWSFIVYGGAAALEIWSPQYFFRVGALVGYILSTIFWLAGWAWSASDASIILRWTWRKDVGGCLAANAALGAFVWIANIVHLVFFIIACVREDNPSSQAELGQVKPEATVPPPAQQHFQQQPVYNQQQQQPVYQQPQGYAQQ
ncbi:hypothetical protein VTJ49DRAFT_3972 [Mycothermus thermophilus]|uniref:MARVEL domain-containing protein n=1 Tax=Humicola insolens TaxID=85995 RepID=A0ABR3V6F7_HUMIN